MNIQTNEQMYTLNGQLDEGVELLLTRPLYARLAANLKTNFLARHRITLNPEAINVPTEQGARALTDIIYHIIAPAGAASSEAGLAHLLSNAFQLHSHATPGEYQRLKRESIALYLTPFYDL